jgi:hypothetical protein
VASKAPKRKACRKETRKALKGLPPLQEDGSAVGPKAVLRRWLVGKCANCRRCPDMAP